MTQRLAALLAYRTETVGQSIALGNSRKPPAFTFPSGKPLWGKIQRVWVHALKRLPSTCPAQPTASPDSWILAPILTYMAAGTQRLGVPANSLQLSLRQFNGEMLVPAGHLRSAEIYHDEKTYVE